MKSANIEIDILNYWHAGTGRGMAGYADSLVIRDSNEIPFLPGRTLKGLLREGVRLAEDFGKLNENITDTLFGAQPRPGRQSDDQPGILIFENAVIEPGIYDVLKSKQELREQLFDTFSSTALDNDGQALEHSLRSIEVVLPLKLVSRVFSKDDAFDWLAPLAIGGRMVRGLGSHRHRGLGRCSIKITRDGDKQE